MKLRSPGVYNIFPWKGKLPIPDSVRSFALTWYNTLRNPDSIETCL